MYERHGNSSAQINVGAFMIRTGFGGVLYCNYKIYK